MIGIVSVIAWVSVLTPPLPSPDIQQIACLQDGTIVGRDGRDALRHWRAGGWGAPEGGGEVRDLWTAPGGQVYARETGPRVVLLQTGLPERHWADLPAIHGGSFTFANDAAGRSVIVTTDAMYQLQADGTAVKLGAPPLFQANLEFRPSQAPTAIATGAGWLACFPTSPFEVDRGMKGVCVGPGSPRYDYRVDFGRYTERTRAAPFACGEVVISAIADRTQARRLADGRRVGQAAGAPSIGSRCLPDGRIMLTGPRGEIRVFDGPRFEHPRRINVAGQIRDVAACAGPLAVLLENSQIVLIDQPIR